MRKQIATDCHAITPILVAKILRNINDCLQLCFHTRDNHTCVTIHVFPMMRNFWPTLYTYYVTKFVLILYYLFLCSTAFKQYLQFLYAVLFHSFFYENTDLCRLILFTIHSDMNMQIYTVHTYKRS